MSAYLRWYRWSPPAFSFGYGQKPEQILDLEKAESQSIPWCKRPTGGALVYHCKDLSYGFAIPRINPFEVNTGDDLYGLVNDAFMKGFHRLGIPVSRPSVVPRFRDVPQDARQLCLAHFSQGDLLATVKQKDVSAAMEQKKIGGSAQRRFRHVWLQQGFFSLVPFSVPDVFRDPTMGVLMQSACIDLQSLGFPFTRVLLQQALTDAMLERFEEAGR